MAGMEPLPQTPAAIARQAGFPMTPPSDPPLTRSPYPTPEELRYKPNFIADTVVKLARPVVDPILDRMSSPEPMPGAATLDWVQNLVRGMVPVRAATASPVPAPGLVPAPGESSRADINASMGAYRPPPLAPWYERMGLVAPSNPSQVPPSGGVRG